MTMPTLAEYGTSGEPTGAIPNSLLLASRGLPAPRHLVAGVASVVPGRRFVRGRGQVRDDIAARQRSAAPARGEADTVLTVLDAQDLLLPPPSRTLKFEGHGYDVDVPYFVVDIDPGRGPDLHRHPYAEIFVPVSGIALLRTGYESIEATPDQVVIVGADTDHAFTNSDEQRLRMICIHASGEMVTEWLEGAQS